MAKSKEELIYDIENELVDPTTNKITGERVKAVLTDIVDAMGTGSGGTMEYWTSPETHNISLTTALSCPLIKGIVDGTMMIGPSTMIMTASNPSDTEVKAIAFDRSTMFFMEGEYATLGDFLSILGWDDSNFIQITEEEFYTI